MKIKKSVLTIISILMVSSLMACAKETKTTNNEPTKTEVKTEMKDENKIELPKDITDKGKGTIQIDTPSGTSENGQVPFIYSDKNDMVIQIGLSSNGFDGSKLSYVLIDGKLSKKQQLGNSQVSLSLKNDNLKVGKHKVEIVQYDNDKTDGNIITYKTVSYEVKAK